MYLTRRLRLYSLSDDKYIACNALTGEVVLVDSAVYQQMIALREGRGADCSADLLQALVEKKLAFESTDHEDAVFLSLVEEAYARHQERARTEYCFAVNTHCNFNCVYCFEAESLRTSVSTLSEEQLDAAFRLVDKSMAKQSTGPEPEFTLYGGEPLLVPSKPTVISIIRRVADRGYKANILTNGYTLPHFFDVFDTHHQSIDSIQITLDGPETEHNQRRVLRSGAGTFSTIVANIDTFLSREYNTRCFIRISFDKKNLRKVDALKQLLDDHGWSNNPRVSVFPVTIQDHQSGGSMEDLIGYDDLLEALYPLSTDTNDGPFDFSSIHVLSHVRNFLAMATKGKQPVSFSPRATFCGGTSFRLFVFHPDGYIYPCYEATGRPHLAIGTYHPQPRFDQEMVEQWAGPRILRQPECFTCSISTFCGGGCANGALAKTGSLNSAFCEGVHEVLDRYFNIIGKLYRDHHSASISLSKAQVPSHETPPS